MHCFMFHVKSVEAVYCEGAYLKVILGIRSYLVRTESPAPNSI